MSGRKIVLTGVTFSNTSLPVLRDDMILPDAGALMLVDVGSGAGGIAAIPSSGGKIPNVAAKQLAVLTGADADSDTLDAIYIEAAGKGTTWNMERSAKGGLHGIVTQTNLSATHGASIRLPDALKTYLVGSTSNDLYVSLWGRMTRRTTLAGNDILSVLSVNISTGANRALFAVLTGGVVYAPTDGQAEFIAGSKPVTGDIDAGDGFIYTHATTTWRTTVPTTIGQITGFHLANWGEGFTGNTLVRSKGSSWVFYRYYMEDLTVSGRSYAEVAAIDAALFNDAVLTPGGRYYGDTYTNPNTIP